MSERGFFSASKDTKTLDGNIFSGFPWLTTQLIHISCGSVQCCLFHMKLVPPCVKGYDKSSTGEV